MPSGTHLNQTKLDLLTCDSESRGTSCGTWRVSVRWCYKGFIGFGFMLGDLMGDQGSGGLPWIGCSQLAGVIL